VGFILPISSIYSYTSKSVDKKLIQSNCTAFMKYILHERLSCGLEHVGPQIPALCKSVAMKRAAGNGSDAFIRGIIQHRLESPDAPYSAQQFAALSYDTPPRVTDLERTASERGGREVKEFFEERKKKLDCRKETRKGLRKVGEKLAELLGVKPDIEKKIVSAYEHMCECKDAAGAFCKPMFGLRGGTRRLGRRGGTRR
jgi:hypothetical protein